MNEYEKLEVRGRIDEPRISLDEAQEFRLSVLALKDTAATGMRGKRIVSLQHDPFAATPPEGRHLQSDYELSIYLDEESKSSDSWRSRVLFRESVNEKDGSLDRAKRASYEVAVEDGDVVSATRAVSITRTAAKIEKDPFGKSVREIIDSQRRSFELLMISEDIEYVVAALRRADKLPRRKRTA